jgi:hypothetical protein
MRSVAALALLLASGCAIRAARSDRYIGPVFHRSVTVCDRGADVSEVLSVGVLAEVGRQSGVALGVADRVAVVPHDDVPGQCMPSGGSHWSFSPLWLSIEHRDQPRLVRRTLAGAQAAVGVETTALSIGGVSTMLIHPPPDAFSVIRFDGRRPMQTHFTVWTVRPGTEVPEAAILEEVTR